MPAEEQITQRLDELLVPHVVRSLRQMNLIWEIRLNDGKVTITLASTALDEGSCEWLKSKIKEIRGLQTALADRPLRSDNQIVMLQNTSKCYALTYFA